MAIAFIFPGQGSQHVGMGREIYEAFPYAREVFEEVDEALQQKLTSLVFEGPAEELTLTENTQPALMAVSMGVARVLEKEGGFSLADKGTFLAGHSLGEYSALCAGKTFSLADTARLLKTRGRAMQEAVPVGQGAMAAILGLSLEEVEEIVQKATLGEEICVIANDNCPGQVVISGHKAAIDRALAEAAEKGAKRSVLLAVSAPFHSPLMMPAAKVMEKALQEVKGVNPSLPLLANVTAEPILSFEDIRKSLVEQVTGRVRWRESLLAMHQKGVDTFVEIGAGKVLSGLAKRIHPDIKAITLNTPQDIEEFLKTVN